MADVSEAPNERPGVAEVFEKCLGCKWTMHVLSQIRCGVQRPGELQRSAEGLTTKVLNERLAKLLRFGILEKKVFAEKLPRVEYRFTEFGERFIEVVDQIESLQIEYSAENDRTA